SSIKVKASRSRSSEDSNVCMLLMAPPLRLFDGTVELARLAGGDRIGQPCLTIGSQRQWVGKLGPGGDRGPHVVGSPHFYLGQAIGINRGPVRGAHDQLQLRAV